MRRRRLGLRTNIPGTESEIKMPIDSKIDILHPEISKKPAHPCDLGRGHDNMWSLSRLRLQQTTSLAL